MNRKVQEILVSPLYLK